jgi:hypothetical protein
MKLSALFYASVRLICDGYGRTWDFDYPNANVDPSPSIWRLGDFVHPSTGNTLTAGINQNYLNPEQKERLSYYAPQILKSRNLKQRYWTGRKLLPDIFNEFYRTYRKDYIDSIEQGTLKFSKNLPGEPGVEPVGPPPDVPVEPEAPPEKQVPAPKAGKAVTEPPAQQGPGAWGLKKPKPLAPKAKPPAPAPEAPPPETDKEQGKRAADMQRSKKMVRRIDQRTKELFDQPVVPPAPEKPEVPPEMSQSEQPFGPDYEEIPPPEQEPPEKELPEEEPPQ